MSRILQYFNLVGVAALAVLLAIQWQANSRLDEQDRNLDQTRQDQASKIADLDKTIKGNATDLEDLRGRLSKSEDTVKDGEKKLAASVLEKKQLQSVADQARAMVAQWQTAIAQRDQRLREQGEALQKLAANRDDLLNKYNELFAKHNDLVGKYNSVVNELNSANKAGH